ncbi:hypothetical protein [Rhizobium sp. LjRoot254]|uniref:hypothetical protein n=1 Tax=Rhizobium sp. LjRoot254 TaxID=3342297 RepID=UPI003ECFCBA2
MFSLQFTLNAALILVALTCLQMIRRAGGGREIVTLRRRSAADVQTTWENLNAIWQATGLTFQPSSVETNPNDGLSG